DGALVLSYIGLDGVERRTRITPGPEAVISGSEISFKVLVPARSPKELYVTVACETGDHHVAVDDYSSAIVNQRETHHRLVDQQSRISTSNEMFNAWVERSLSDMRMLITSTHEGPFPYGGVPWYACPFGRDSIITAYEMLWLDPTMARSVLAFLAATQATEIDVDRAAQPGKVIHELRSGELAATGEVPFGRYYGSVDATPLFVALAGEYLAHTNDVDFLASIWDPIEAALTWCDTYGDVDGDGFVEYHGSERGLIQQGWKDSHDSVFHADGAFARPPIALCEVQGYVYWAKRNAARVARALGKLGRAVQLEEQAAILHERFEAVFWVPEIDMYALALDGDKRPCAVRTSNAGHLLLTGIVSDERAKLVATALTSDQLFSGWGIRTLATSETRYGPITYHNGSVWPHDNALIAQGLANYGFKKDVHRIMSALLDASGSFEFHRLPELYCGFPRRPGQGPIGYPLACAPQAWAAGSVFLLLRAALGLSVEAANKRVVLTRPSLPAFLKEVRIQGLRAGDASVDLALHHHDDDVGVNITGRSGDVEVVVVK
ncbi:MAG: amylo-alpha-1,6-glucosidase, partial [Actinomycetota bacterium]